METVSIRDLRGDSLRENALRGKPLAITNRGTLIGVLIPMAAAWVEHLIDYNWSHVRESIAEGELSLHTAPAVATLADVIPEIDAIGYEPEQALQGAGTLERLQAALNPSASAVRQASKAVRPSLMTVRIGDLTPSLIEKTSTDGHTLAITHDRELIGIVIPVTRSLLDFLIEQNMSRILYNIGLSERQIRSLDPMTTLDEALYAAD